MTRSPAMELAAWLEALWKDPERRSRAMYWLWLASGGMVVLGWLIIVQHYWAPALP